MYSARQSHGVTDIDLGFETVNFTVCPTRIGEPLTATIMGKYYVKINKSGEFWQRNFHDQSYHRVFGPAVIHTDGSCFFCVSLASNVYVSFSLKS